MMVQVVKSGTASFSFFCESHNDQLCAMTYGLASSGRGFLSNAEPKGWKVPTLTMDVPSVWKLFQVEVGDFMALSLSSVCSVTLTLRRLKVTFCGSVGPVMTCSR